MSAQQLCFFKFGRPLVDLLGLDFFRGTPAGPGVYLFLGEGARVLYVGQSKNLRLRLSYYKNAQPEREPRRIIRLVHQTRSIELQRCETAAAAQAREVELIQEHRPRFNVQHALSRTYSFFVVAAEGDRLRVRLTLDQPAADTDALVGAFKNRGLCRRSLFAIARTIWSGTHSPRNIFEIPMGIMDRSKLNELLLDKDEKDENLRDDLLKLLSGESPQFLQRTEAVLARENDAFLRKLFESDHATLAEFFELTVRMRTLRERSGSAVLPQLQVDRMQIAAIASEIDW